MSDPGQRLPSGINEVFGFAAPGYLLVLYVVLSLWAIRMIELDTFTSTVFAILGLPIGYLWTYGFYHPIIWGRVSGEWDKFATEMGRDFVGKTRLKAEDAREIANRAYVYLRWVEPAIGESMVFYHVRQHTLRSCGTIAIIATPFLYLSLYLGGRLASIAVILFYFILCLVIVFTGCGMWKAAETELGTLLSHYEFVTRQNGPRLAEWAKNFIRRRKVDERPQ